MADLFVEGEMLEVGFLGEEEIPTTTTTSVVMDVNKSDIISQIVPLLIPKTENDSCIYESTNLEHIPLYSDNPPFCLFELDDSCPESELKNFDELSRIQNNLLSNFNLSSSIHSESSIHFYESVLKAPDLVIRTLKYGYEPVFTSKPNSYFETNNKSARDNLLFFQDEVVKLLNNNIIQKLDHRPLVCSPMTVNIRTCCLTNTTKKR